ncbi:MAG: hypothetical protein JKY04_05910 [Sneathiella sp.]|nr:hypothetical protein [Sneathiella sp.]
MINQKNAISTLQTAMEELDQQDISVLPKEAQLQLVRAQRNVYLELQAQQANQLRYSSAEFVMATTGLKDSEGDFRDIHKWAKSAEKSGKFVTGILKGISLILTLL